MKKFLSLGSALLMGVVLGKEKSYEFQADKHHSNKHSEIVKNTHQYRDHRDYAVKEDLSSRGHTDRSASFESVEKPRGKAVKSRRDHSREGLKDRHTRAARKHASVTSIETESNPATISHYVKSASHESRHHMKKVRHGSRNSYKVKGPKVATEVPNVPNGGYIVLYFYFNSLLCANDNYGRTMCYTDDGWEWYNMWEIDGTVDNSELTSIETDGQLWTSPSVDSAYRRGVSVKSTKRRRANRSHSTKVNMKLIAKEMHEEKAELDKLKHLSADLLRDHELNHRDHKDSLRELDKIIHIKEKANKNFKKWAAAKVTKKHNDKVRVRPYQ